MEYKLRQILKDWFERNNYSFSEAVQKLKEMGFKELSHLSHYDYLMSFIDDIEMIVDVTPTFDDDHEKWDPEKYSYLVVNKELQLKIFTLGFIA